MGNGDGDGDAVRTPPPPRNGKINNKKQNSQEKQKRNKIREEKKEAMEFDRQREIISKSKKEFKKCIPLLTSEKEYLHAFYSFLYSDIMKMNSKKNMGFNINLKNNVNFNTNSNMTFDILQEYISTFNDKMSSKSDVILKEFKKRILLNLTRFRKKVEECEKNMKMLSDSYIDIEINKIFPSAEKKKLSFENNSILFQEGNAANMSILSEFFSKYILSSGDKVEFETFYDNDKLNFFSDTGPISFDEMNPNFKYWFLLVFFIKNMFAKSSNYDILYNPSLFTEYIKKLVKREKKKEEGDKKKKDQKKGNDKKNPKKKQKGGYTDNNWAKKQKAWTDKNKAPNKNKASDKNKKKESEDVGKKEREQYISIFKNNKYKDRSLEAIYVTPYIKSMKKYFENVFTLKMKNSPHKTYAVKVEHPFNSSITLPFSDIFEYDPKKVGMVNKNGKEINIIPVNKTAENINNHNLKAISIIFDKISNNMVFSIFDFLYVFIDTKNEVEVRNFFEKVGNKTILLLYYLHFLKRDIYVKYINLLEEIVEEYDFGNEYDDNNDDDNEDENKNNHKGNAPSMTENNRYENMTNEKRQCMMKIKELENKKKKTENENIILTELQKFELEDELKRMYVKLYSMNA